MSGSRPRGFTLVQLLAVMATPVGFAFGLLVYFALQPSTGADVPRTVAQTVAEQSSAVGLREHLAPPAAVRAVLNAPGSGYTAVPGSDPAAGPSTWRKDPVTALVTANGGFVFSADKSPSACLDPAAAGGPSVGDYTGGTCGSAQPPAK